MRLCRLNPRRVRQVLLRGHVYYVLLLFFVLIPAGSGRSYYSHPKNPLYDNKLQSHFGKPFFKHSFFQVTKYGLKKSLYYHILKIGKPIADI